MGMEKMKVQLVRKGRVIYAGPGPLTMMTVNVLVMGVSRGRNLGVKRNPRNQLSIVAASYARLAPGSRSTIIVSIDLETMRHE